VGHGAMLDQLPFGGEPGEELVATLDGDFERSCFQRPANSPLPEVEVQGVMHPIVAVVAVQVVGSIVRIDPNRQVSARHCWPPFELHVFRRSALLQQRPTLRRVSSDPLLGTVATLRFIESDERSRKAQTTRGAIRLTDGYARIIGGRQEGDCVIVPRANGGSAMTRTRRAGWGPNAYSPRLTAVRSTTREITCLHTR
jgi:hypothetical protein